MNTEMNSNKPKILFIVGSMREKSFNKQLAEKTKSLIGERAEVSFLHYADIPYMNQDLESSYPETVVKAREAVKESDGIWIFTPEYNGFLPGVLKNLLDWLSRPLEAGNPQSGTAVKGKKVTFSGVGGGRKTAGSRGQLDKLLHNMMMDVMSEPSCGFAVPFPEMKADDWKITPEEVDMIEEQINAFLKFLSE